MIDEEQLAAALSEVANRDPLQALEMAARWERLARSACERAAVAAVAAGWSWSEIGAAYGVSKQAAHQRFSRHVPH